MTDRRRSLFLPLLACLLLYTQVGHGQAWPDDPHAAVPQPLAPWVPWVLHGHAQDRCTLLPGVDSRVCAWPSLLSLSLDDDGGSFALDILTERDMYVPLPGSATRFPQEVSLDEESAVVLEGPKAYVPSGSHRLSGRFAWRGLPESLRIPPQVGLLRVTAQGRAVAEPRRDEDGTLWLLSRSGSAEDEKRLDLKVHRKLVDGVPLRVITRLLLSVGGRAREVLLSRTLLSETLPIDIESDLPVHLEPDGQLRVQVVAGEHRVTIHALAPSVPEKLQMPEPEGIWPQQEVWVWAADPELRQVELSGGTRVEPRRTDLEQDWHGMPTFLLEPGQDLTFETRRRGDAAPPPNRLSLSREMWLDLGGGHYTVRDTLSGTMHQRFRLDLTQGELGRARLRDEDQLITRFAERNGVEVRDSDVQLRAEWRLPRKGEPIPAVAWSTDVEHLVTLLHLPPGWSLFHAEGVDAVSGTTLSEWDLWSFFFVLLVTLAAIKLRGLAVGLLGLLALSLCYHEPMAPELLWLWLLGAMALTRLPLKAQGQKAARGLYWAAVAAVALWSLPFVVYQVRSALYPQLEESDGRGSIALEAPQEEAVTMERLGGAASLADRDAEQMNSESAPRPQRKMKRAEAYRSALDEVDPNAVVQTGPGVPNWHHHSYTLHWSGPVSQEQQIALWLLPPVASRGLALLRVLLLGAFLAALLNIKKSSSGPKRRRRAPWGGPAITAVACAAHLSWPQPGRAQQASPGLTDPDPASGAPALTAPSPELLAELRQRLLSEPDCSGPCISASDLSLTVRANRLTIRAKVHAGATTTYRAPGPLSAFAPDALEVDGSPKAAAARMDDGFLHLRLPPGAHDVELSGPMPRSDALTLQLGTPPHHIAVSASDWEVDGLREDGSENNTIQLRRRVASTMARDGRQGLPPWLRIRRRFQFGLQFRVETFIERLGDAGIVTFYPLLPGESITEAHVDDKDGAAVIRLESSQTEERFNSTLTPRAELTLQTPAAMANAQRFSEVWEIHCSPLYRCVTDGLVPQTRVQNGKAVEIYQPLPGERLTVRLARLLGAEGASTTVDGAKLVWTPGKRITTGELSLQLRSSSGTTSRITLPPGAQLGRVEVDNEARTAQLRNGTVELTLEPGNHDLRLPFKLDSGVDLRFVAKAVKVQGELVNTQVIIHVPDNRWLLWVTGPAWGPAVLFWGYLLTVLIVAFGLSRWSHSPLRMHQWALLALGLSQVPPLAASVVVLWFFAVWARARHIPPGRVRFNLVQIAMLILTASAIGILLEAVHQGLILRPDMQVAGHESDNQQLSWYVDRTRDQLPTPSFFSLPLWAYKALMLAWALWLAASALTWLRDGYRAFSHGGRFKSLRGPTATSVGTVAAESGQATTPATKAEQAERSADQKEQDPPTGDQ